MVAARATALREAAVSVLLTISLGLNVCQFFDARGWWAAAAATSNARRLDGQHSSASPSPSELSRMQDCASVACPRAFTEAQPAVVTGGSRMRPMLADSRFRPHPPHSMLELTQLLYGDQATVGEPYKGFENVWHRAPSLKYEWTQISESMLEQVWAMLPNGGRNAKLVVEVGSFVGRSSVLIGGWLRRREREQPHHGASPPLLCIDTWLGDLGMTLDQIYPAELGKRHGQSTLYHVWLLNIMQSNLTERVLPLVAPSFLGARVLDFLRLSADVIYLDSAHEARETFFELTLYWPLVRPGGVLLGDDFNWWAVSHDVQLFARVHGLTVNSFDGCHEKLMLDAPGGGLCVWYIQKPATEKGHGGPMRRPALQHRKAGS